MALGTPVTIGSSGASQTGSTRTLTTTAAIPAGATGIIGFSIEGGPTVLSVTDDAGHTWTVDVSHTTGTNPNTDVHFASVYLPGGLASGAVITVTFSSSTTGNQHIHGCYVTGWAVIDRSAVGGNTSLATAWTTAATAAARADGCVALGFAFASQNASNSDQTGSTPAMTELSDTNRCVMTYATGINSSAVTAAGTWNSASRNVCIAGIYKELVIGVTETDTAGAMTRRKAKALGQASETDTAGALTRPIPAPTTIASGNSGANSASQTITLTVAVPLGATVLVWGGFGVSGSRTLQSVTDSQGNTYAIDVTNGSAGAQYAVGIARSVIATALGIGDTITLNWSGAASTQIKYGYAAKVQTVLVKDQSNSNNAGTSNPHSWTSGNLATTRASELIFGGSLTNAAVGGATPTNSNIELFDSGGVGIASAEVVYRIVSATGTFAATGTYGSGNASDFACGVSYYERKQILLGRASETDTAGAVTRRPLLGQPSETDTAGTTTPRGVAKQASETDTAGALTSRKTKAIGQASDAETAGVITPFQSTGGQTITVAQASETDTAGATTARKTKAIGQATDTETAGAVVRLILGRATETDTARKILLALRRAREQDTAGQFVKPQFYVLSRAIEDDTAGAVVRVYTLGQASETDTARTLTVVWFPLIDRATETDTAGAVVRVLINRASETDTARAIARLILGIASEADTAQPITITLYLFPDVFDLPDGESVVFAPALIRSQPLEPTFITATGSTVFEPALQEGQPLEVDDVIAPTSVVFSPRLQSGQAIYPDVGPTGTPVVFAPELIRGQLLEPNTGPTGTPTVFQPALAHAQEIDVGTGPTGTPTVFQPALAHAQEIRPNLVNDPLAGTVFEPALAEGQELHVDERIEPDEATVFEPALTQTQPSEIAAGGTGQTVHAMVRTAV